MLIEGSVSLRKKKSPKMTLKFCVLRLVKIQEDLFGLGPPAGCVFLSHLSLFLLFDDV